jgi:hypothetical protein
LVEQPAYTGGGSIRVPEVGDTEPDDLKALIPDIRLTGLLPDDDVREALAGLAVTGILLRAIALSDHAPLQPPEGATGREPPARTLNLLLQSIL